ncbi:MAG: hypothetical protein HRT41_06520 [Campylobacteraceae bacterium]|nr:hypothetical protein [Campylobacteraceae bacterium]
MFKQVKSALFWYYLYKFRKRVLLIVLLLSITLFSNAIYGDIVEYLQISKQLQYLKVLLIVKWCIILFNIVFSAYLVLTLFKNKEKEKENKEKKTNKKEEFSKREKEFLYKKNLRNKADILLDK